MPRMRRSIFVQSCDPDRWGRRVTVEWPQHGWTTPGDNSIDDGGSDTAPDGFGLMGAAFGVCMVTTLISNAKDAKIPLQGVVGLVSTKAKVPARGAPRLSDFHIDIYLEGDLTEHQRSHLQESTTQLCGVRETLAHGASVTEAVHIGVPPVEAEAA